MRLTGAARGALVVAVTTAAVGSAAAVRLERREGAADPAAAAALEVPAHSVEAGVVGLPGVVTVFGSNFVVVNEPVTVDRVEMYGVRGDVDLLDTRMSFLSCARCPREYGRTRVNGRVLATCTHTWPPPGFGPTEPATGGLLSRGANVSFLLYLRSDQVGQHGFEGFRVVYRVDGRTRHLDVPSGGRVRVVERPDYEARLRNRRSVCEIDKQSVWFGHDVRDGYRVD